MNTDEDIKTAINNAGDIGCTYTPYITESEYRSMLTLIDMLMDRDPDPKTPDGIWLSELVRIIEQYESKHYPSLSPTPVYDSYQLWQLLHEEHGLILLNGEIEDIINVATPIIEQRKKSRKEEGGIMKDVRQRMSEWPVFMRRGRVLNETARSDVECSRLLAEAEAMEDEENSIYAAELFLLRKIAETSADLVKANNWEEFCEACGGIEYFIDRHAEATSALEKWHADGDERPR